MAGNVRRIQPNRAASRKAPIYIDYLMLFCVFLLVVFGLLMLYSCTAYKSHFDELVGQFIAFLVGIVALVVGATIDVRGKRFAFIAGLVGVVSILILLTPMGVTLNGARRWFKLPGIPMTVQSAEIVKTVLIIILAYMLASKKNYLGDLKNFGRVGIVAFGFAGLLGIVSSNMSSALIILMICAVMVFVADRRYALYIAGIALVVLVAFTAVFLIKNDFIDLGFRGGRIKMWLDPENNVSGVDSFQTVHGLYAIGSGGLTGKGIGEGLQKMKLPEAQNDMVFAVICEELGLVGAGVVIIIYAILIYRLMVLAKAVPSFRDKLIISGVFAHIAIQALLNIAVVTNSIPNTGVGLPFISSGGSSLLFLMFEIGMVINVTKGLGNVEEE